MLDSNLSILVVEDDTVTRETVGSVLEDEGYRVLLAQNGTNALVKFAKDIPDLVLTDLNMAGGDGFMVLNHVRETKPGLPVIIFTADQTHEAKREAQRLGAADFINKPVDLDDMLARIAHCLGFVHSPALPTPAR